MEDLHGTWEFPYLVCFCQVYSGLLSLPSFSAEELERHLFSGTNEAVSFFYNLTTSLLKGFKRSKHIDIHKDLFRQLEMYDPEGPMIEKLKNNDFIDLSANDRVTVLRQLCDIRLHHADDIAEALKGVPSEDQRFEPIGQDINGNKYWYFNDTRLYLVVGEEGEGEGKKDKKKGKGTKKGTATKPGKAPGKGSSKTIPDYWIVKCHDEATWTAFMTSLKKSRAKCDKQLHLDLSEVYPTIIVTIQAQERAERKRLMYESMPRRQSGRVMAMRMHEEQLARDLAERQQEEEELRKQRALLAGVRSARVLRGDTQSVVLQRAYENDTSKGRAMRYSSRSANSNYGSESGTNGQNTPSYVSDLDQSDTTNTSDIRHSPSNHSGNYHYERRSRSRSPSISHTEISDDNESIIDRYTKSASVTSFSDNNDSDILAINRASKKLRLHEDNQNSDCSTSPFPTTNEKQGSTTIRLKLSPPQPPSSSLSTIGFSRHSPTSSAHLSGLSELSIGEESGSNIGTSGAPSPVAIDTTSQSDVIVEKVATTESSVDNVGCLEGSS